MSQTIEIEVTKDDIENASVCNPRNCPVARGTKRVTGTTSVTVGCAVISVVTPEGFFRYEVPTEVEAKILAFDANGKMEPFKFSARQLEKDEFGRVANRKSPHPDYARH